MLLYPYLILLLLQIYRLTVVPDALEPMSTEEVLLETTSDNTVALMSVPNTPRSCMRVQSG